MNEQWRIVAYRDSAQARLASHKGMISLRELQSATGEELDALLPSVLDRAFKGELQYYLVKEQNMPIPISNYLRDLGVEGIVRLASQWKERQSGYQDEITTEDLCCLKDGRYLRMTVIWTKKFFPTNSISPWIQSETPITQEEYEKICKENGGILDTPELLQAINKRIELERTLRELIPACPKCGHPMTLRSGKRGDFWGCTRYPKCKGTLDWDNDLAEQRDAIYKELEKYENM